MVDDAEQNPANEPASQPTSQPASQATSRPVSQATSRPVNQSESETPNPEPTEVDFDDLAAAVTFIEGLVDDLDGIRYSQVNRSIVPHMDGDALNAPFGLFTEAQTLWSSAKQATETIRTRLTTLNERLERLKSGTKTIATEYHTVEARNAMSPRQVEAMLDSSAAGKANTPST